jgi:hypothetical protein
VSALTKDMRLPHDVREEAYAKTLREAGWQVKVLKLADIYDNLADCRHLSAAGRIKTAKKTRFYLDAIRPGLPEHAQNALRLVEGRLAELESRLTS